MGIYKDREKQSILQVAGLLSNDVMAETWFIQQRWTNGISCPNCEKDKVTERANVRGKRTWRCNDCRKDFTTKSGTLMQGSNLGYRTWALAIYLLTIHLKGIASTKPASDLGITQKSAWHLAHRIRETYIGGKEKNKHYDEFAGRHNDRGSDTIKRMSTIASGLVGRRLLLAELIG